MGESAYAFIGRTVWNQLKAAARRLPGDALAYAALAALLYLWRGWRWVDPATSLLIAVLIVVSTWSLFRQSLHLLFDGVPEHLDVAAIRARLLGLRGVQGLHDLHVWAMGTSEPAMSVHLVADPAAQSAETLLRSVGSALHDQFEIVHVTVQLETRAFAKTCAMRSLVDAAVNAPVFGIPETSPS